MPPPEAVVSLWVESLQSAYSLARGERLNDLRGTKGRFLDARGLHPFSAIWGRVEAAQALCPDLNAEGLATSPHALWKAGREDADAEFRAEILEAAA